jgi:5-hydroxyisourate hydrolase-like protein (transthyretin family)
MRMRRCSGARGERHRARSRLKICAQDGHAYEAHHDAPHGQGLSTKSAAADRICAAKALRGGVMVLVARISADPDQIQGNVTFTPRLKVGSYVYAFSVGFSYFYARSTIRPPLMLRIKGAFLVLFCEKHYKAPLMVSAFLRKALKRPLIYFLHIMRMK